MTAPGLIRIGELSRRVDISVDRLRAWERRYGVLRPQRTAGGFRLYSTADETRLRAMQRQLAAGLSAAEAAVAVLAADAPVANDATRREELDDALAAFDAVRADAILDGLFADLGVDEAMRAIVFPLLRDVGERWARADMTVGQEHFTSGLLQARLLALLRAPAGTAAGPRALLACPPGELHTLGLIAFGIALRNRAWSITYLGPDTPIAEISSVAAAISPAVVVLSALMPTRFADVQDELRELAARVRLALAGAAASAALAQRVGAELLESDPVSAADAFSHA
jgi:MerR family transcriptional regulator, light-induced transcriptional regulator